MANVTTLIPWFGGNRTNAKTPGELLGKRKWIGVPFAGGMPEVPHLSAPSIVVSDKHRHIINLCNVISDDYSKSRLVAKLNATPFHPDSLANAQSIANSWVWDDDQTDTDRINAATAYFVSQWLGRSGKAGTDDEFKGNLSTRWNGNGGDSCKRFRSAIESLEFFSDAMARCSFSVLDAFEFLEHCGDDAKLGIYIDAPWPDAGKKYRHKVDDGTFHEKLRDQLLRFNHTGIVVRYGDHELTNGLYADWERHEASGRTQHGNAAESFFTRNI